MFASDAWESVLEGAVHEPDPMLADVKIRMVEEAIFDRIHDYSTSPGSLEEQVIRCAWSDKGDSDRSPKLELITFL